MTVTHKSAPQEPPSSIPAWLLLIFSLPTKRATERVNVWRQLRRFGALQLPSSGYVLPNTQENQEHFEWLAAAIRKYKGQASVIQVHAINDRPGQQLREQFIRARSADYEELLKAIKKKGPSSISAVRVRKQFQEISAIDFFDSPLRSRVEAVLARIDSGEVSDSSQRSGRLKRKYTNRTWVTRPRPGIDRVSSAWLIRNFIDANAKFAFSDDPARHPNAVPFDMFQPGGFGHRGEDCTFETLRKEFAIRESKVTTVAEMIHDADVQDDKFGRPEATGLDRVLIGWAQQGISDEELLRRGMELIEGMYHGIS
jgi:hypothetical protein